MQVQHENDAEVSEPVHQQLQHSLNVAKQLAVLPERCLESELDDFEGTFQLNFKLLYKST